MNKRIEEIRERCERATPGPWGVEEDILTAPEPYHVVMKPYYDEDTDVVSVVIFEQDLDFITHAREDIPFLLSQLEEKNREIERLQKEVAALAIESVERDKALAKLEAEVQHWADAEKEGLLVMLPCKVGDTLYTLSYKPKNGECDECCPCKIDGYGQCSLCEQSELCVVEIAATLGTIERIGFDMWLTREEAEQALKED